MNCHGIPISLMFAKASALIAGGARDQTRMLGSAVHGRSKSQPGSKEEAGAASVCLPNRRHSESWVAEATGSDGDVLQRRRRLGHHIVYVWNLGRNIDESN